MIYGLMAGFASLSMLSVPTAVFAQDFCSLMRALTSSNPYDVEQVEIRTHYGDTRQIYVDQFASLPREADACTLDLGTEIDWIDVDLECEWLFEDQSTALNFLNALAQDAGPCLPASMEREDEEIEPDMPPVPVSYLLELDTGDGGELYVEMYFRRGSILDSEPKHEVILLLMR